MPEAYRSIRTKALREAIKHAPGDISDKKEMTNISNLSIDRMCQAELPEGYLKDLFPHSFKEMHKTTIDILKKDKDKEAFNRYLFSTTTEFASSMMLFEFPDVEGENKEQILVRLRNQTEQFFTYQFLAAHYLLQGLTTSGSKEYKKIQDEMVRTLRRDAVEDTLLNVTESIKKTFGNLSATGRALTLLTGDAFVSEKGRDSFINSKVDGAKAEFLSGKSKKPPIRFMMGIYDEVAEYCKSNNIENPLLNLTLGDVTGLGMAEEVAEALALNPTGPKGLMLAARARMYIQLAYMSAASGKDKKVDDKQRYEGDSLGWGALRDKFIQYGQDLGLYKKNKVVGSIIGEGGADALYRVSRIIRSHLEEKNGGPLPEGQKFEAYFANPAFRMVSAKVRDAGFDVHEEQTTLDQNS